MDKTPVGGYGWVYRWRLPFLIALLSCYWAVGFYPYTWTESARYSPNGAKTDASGILTFDAPGIAVGALPPSWINKVKHGASFELDLTVKPSLPKATRVTTIFSVSADLTARDIAIDQDESGFLVWVRTSDQSSKGSPHFFGKIFEDRDWHNIRVALTPGLLEIYIDGHRRLSLKQASLDASSWFSFYQVALGNEQTGDMPWLGDIKKAVVTVDGEAVDYLSGSAISIPGQLMTRVGSVQASWVPFSEQITAETLRDWTVNFLGFIPLGIATLLLVRRHIVIAALVFSALVSISIELGQLYIAVRTSQIDDVLFNTGGGVIGALIGVRFLSQSPALGSKKKMPAGMSN